MFICDEANTPKELPATRKPARFEPRGSELQAHLGRTTGRADQIETIIARASLHEARQALVQHTIEARETRRYSKRP